MVVFYVEAFEAPYGFSFPYKEFRTFTSARKYAKSLSETYSDVEFFVSVMTPDARFINGKEL